MKVTPAIVALVVVAAATGASSRESGVAHAAWCATDTGPPPQVIDRYRMMPDREGRGMRTGAELYALAVAAARAGRDDEAIAWLTDGCQHHNREAADAIKTDRAAVLKYLRG